MDVSIIFYIALKFPTCWAIFMIFCVILASRKEQKENTIIFLNLTWIKNQYVFKRFYARVVAVVVVVLQLLLLLFLQTNLMK